MNSVQSQIQSSYDDVPYVTLPVSMSHPRNLHCIAAIAGVQGVPVTNCRVLEIGCGTGGNLIPMAQALPGSQFLGLDLSPHQIDMGVEVVRRVGLKNIELRSQNLLDFSENGQFDYVIAHGFYSWVPKHVRDQALLVCQRCLSPNGLAYFSYNTLPGWHLKRIAHDMMLFHSSKSQNPKQRVALAREMIGLAASIPEGRPVYLGVLRELANHVKECEDWYLLHDDMELVNEAVYFRDFIGHIAQYGLKHLACATPTMEPFRWLPASFQAKLREFSEDEIERVQYLDFITGVSFRASVLSRAELASDARQSARALDRLFVSGRLLEVASPAPATVTFCHAIIKSKKINVTDASVIAAFRKIKDCWPRAISFTELLEIANGVGGNGLGAASEPLHDQILRSYQIAMLELSSGPMDSIGTNSEQPKATPLARLQAAAGGPIANLRHESIGVDAAMRHLLPLLDGTRDRSAIRKELVRLVENGTLSNLAGADSYQALDQLLRNFNALSLLTA